MTRRAALVLAACALAAVLASCTRAGGHVAGPRGGALPPGAARLLGLGSLYLLAGPGPYSANLWRVDLPSGRSTQLTLNRAQYGVSNFDASPAGLVMGDARSSVDVLDALAHRKPVQIGDGVGDGPVISASGQIAYEIDAAPPYKGEWKYYRIVLRDGLTGPPRTIYRERRYGNLGLVNWSPDGNDIMVSQGPDSGRYDALLIITPAGRVVGRLPAVRPNPDNLVWGPKGLAVGNGLFHSGPNEVLNLSGRVEYTPPGGWVPMCWNPAGTAMIAFRAPHEIGLWRLARPGTVRALGPLPLGGLLECRWLSRPAAGT